MLLGLRRVFGRLTEEAWRREVVREATKLAQQHRVAAMQHHAISNRARLDARHHSELAEHYRAKASDLSPTQQDDHDHE